jgi:hypothetical protein
MAADLHSTSLLCIVTAGPKMADTQDVTPLRAPVDISMKDPRLPSLKIGGDFNRAPVLARASHEF